MSESVTSLDTKRASGAFFTGDVGIWRGVGTGVVAARRKRKRPSPFTRPIWGTVCVCVCVCVSHFQLSIIRLRWRWLSTKPEPLHFHPRTLWMREEALGVPFMTGRDVNCVPLPLNCLLVVLITVLIDAEIKLLPRASGGEWTRVRGWQIKDDRSEHMEMALLWKSALYAPPAPHGEEDGSANTGS